MSKFSRLAQAGNGPAAYPGAQANAAPPYPSQVQPNQRPPSSPYNAPPPTPPRPGASPQPQYQQPQSQYQPPPWQSPQPQQNMYGNHLGGPPPQQSYPSPQSQYASPQQTYSSFGSQYQQTPPPQQQQPQQQQQWAQPQYQQHQQYQPQPSPYGPQQGGRPPGQGPPPQQQYGGPGGQQYGGGPPPPQQQPAGNAGAYRQLLQSAIQEKGLQNFYPQGSPLLEHIVQRAPQQVAQLAAQWRINTEIASDIVKLALYDVILYVDDSGSMAFEENGERIDDLKLILNRVAFATSLFDDDGIQVRFMNSVEQGNGIRNEQQVTDLVGRTRFSGLTPMGRELQNKILGPLVLGPARSGQLRKPVLVITVTDGQPTGESHGDVAKIMMQASQELQRNPRYGKGALAFQFAQVGNDLKAREFLGKLDEEPSIGDIIDCTSNYEVEADEMSRANPPVNLSPELWLIKLLLGSIDSSYDTKDEKGNAPPPPQGGPGGGYGGPPPGQYGGGGYPGQQQGGYPPQQGGYGGPQGGGYGAQQQQQYGQAQQGQYGRPPPGPPSGGYGQPPQPPRY